MGDVLNYKSQKHEGVQLAILNVPDLFLCQLTGHDMECDAFPLWSQIKGLKNWRVSIIRGRSACLFSENILTSSPGNRNGKVAFVNKIDVYSHALVRGKTYKFRIKTNSKLTTYSSGGLGRSSLNFSSFDDSLVLSNHFLRRVSLALEAPA